MVDPLALKGEGQGLDLRPACPQPSHGRKYMHGDTLICKECRGLIPGKPSHEVEPRAESLHEDSVMHRKAANPLHEVGAGPADEVGMFDASHYLAPPTPDSVYPGVTGDLDPLPRTGEPKRLTEGGMTSAVKDIYDAVALLFMALQPTGCDEDIDRLMRRAHKALEAAPPPEECSDSEPSPSSDSGKPKDSP